jgi:hypothetical protein
VTSLFWPYNEWNGRVDGADKWGYVSSSILVYIALL